MPEASLQTSTIRRAVRADIDRLTALIEVSVRELQRAYYSPAQIELALGNVFGVDTVLIDDGTYFVIEEAGEIVAGGGWSKRATLCGSDHFTDRSDELLDPATGAAKIRAFFVRPSHARRGLASVLLERCEREAIEAGFRRAEMGATLSGVPFYATRGYAATGRADVALSTAESLPVVLMERSLETTSAFGLRPSRPSSRVGQSPKHS